MSQNHLLALVVLALGVATPLSGAERWQKMKAGMTRHAMRSMLGDPLIRSSGRGFEVWVYDNRAEVVCIRGVVVAWTAPGGKPNAEGGQVDVSGVAAPEASSVRSGYVPRGEAGHGYEPVIPRRARFRGLY